MERQSCGGDTLSLKRELKRKTLHLAGLLVPALYMLVGRDWSISIISIILIAFFIIEPIRVSFFRSKELLERMRPYITPDVYKFLEQRLDKMMKSMREIEREEERLCIGAHIYFAIASLVVIILFPKYIVIGAITVATLGDAVAALIGKPLGKHRFKNGKSWEGSIAFFLTAFAVLFFILPYGYNMSFVIPAAILGAIIGTLVELFNVPPNDNFSNQIFISLALYLLLFLF